jgi:hypothetical protein
MGCGVSRTHLNGIDVPLDHYIEQTGVDDVDERLKEASEIIYKIETFRLKLIDEFDDLVVHSGACAFKDPDLTKLIISFLTIAEYECNGFLKSIEQCNAPPMFKYTCKLNPKTQKVYDRITGLTKCLIEMGSFEGQNTIRDLKESLVKSQGDYEKMISEKYKETPAVG